MNKDHKYKIHWGNIRKKKGDKSIASNKKLFSLIEEVEKKYEVWAKANLALDNSKLSEEKIALKKIDLFNEYRNFLDEPKFDVFDSRGNLQSSALEEFCYYFLRPLFVKVEDKLAIGHHLVFQDLYFTSDTFKDFAEFPNPNFPVNNLDFVIGKRVRTTMDTESKSFSTDLYIPAVAIECKTYLDRPRFIESDIMAKNIKKGFPSCLYILLSEFLKLDTDSVNIRGSEIDRIYVVRRKHNTDRKIRRAKSTSLVPLYPPALMDMYHSVKTHLQQDWDSNDPYETGILKG